MAEENKQDSVAAAPGSGSTSAKLFLGGLSWETTEDKLKQYFSKYGEVEDVVVMKDRVTKTPRGFGFITFQSQEAAQRACQETHNIDGRTIDAKPSVPQGEGQKPRSKKIFVGGLAPETTDEQFKAYFETFGKVLEAQIMVDHTSGRSRGFGFVTFEDEEAVQKVFDTGSMHELGGKQVEVKNATPKGSGPQSGRGSGRGHANMAGGRGYANGGGRGYGQYQQNYGMGGYGYGMAYGQQQQQYGYGMPYGGYPGMMMGYNYGTYGYGYANNQGQGTGRGRRGQQAQQQQAQQVQQQ